MAKAIIFAMLLLAIGAITGSATTADEELFTRCAPMYFIVENLSPGDSQKTGLIEKAIENAVESRLRSARLFAPSEDQNRPQYLYINVNIIRNVFNILVQLKRYFDDLGYGEPGIAAVWQTGAAGGHGGDGQYILGVVSEYLDEFIASYLRVNEEHCSR